MICELRTLGPLFLVLFPIPLVDAGGIDPRAREGAEVAGRKRPGRVTTAQPAGWLQRIERQIARSEYFWSATADGSFTAPNRSNGLRSQIASDGIEVRPREGRVPGGDPTWNFSLRTVGFGYEGDVRLVGDSEIVQHQNRIERLSRGFIEWFVNDECGVEQGWTILEPPPGVNASTLRIELESAGLRACVSDDGCSIAFVEESGATRLRYHGLRAWDAIGTELSARMSATRRGFVVEVAGDEVLYPITVDPFLSGPTWTATSGQAGSEFGVSVAGAGDVNGDGFDDVLVGARFFDNGQEDEGRAFLYLGSPSGPSLAPDWFAESDQEDAEFGFSVSGAGDVDGDGFDDILVGARLFDSGQEDEGAAFLYLGSPSGPSLTWDWIAESDQALAQFAYSVAGAGDLNGDGFDDVIVGARYFSNGQAREGRAFMYFGSASGLSFGPDRIAEGDQDLAYFGTSVSGAGDVNGDGFVDVMVGAPGYSATEPFEGRVFLYLGSAGGPSFVPNWVAESGQSYSLFSESISAAGDVNRDGFDDIIVGASRFGNGEHREGRAFLYLGSVSGPSITPDWTAEVNVWGAGFGYSASGAGDVNGDGFDDVIVGAPFLDVGPDNNVGRVYLYLGSAAGPALGPGWTADGDHAAVFFGGSVSRAGDVNGDGLGDIIVGAPWDFGGQAAVYVGQDCVDCNGNGVCDNDDLSSGNSNDVNGNGIPDECETIGTLYCSANPNSTGSAADIRASGSASSSAGDLTLEAGPVPDQPGLFYHGSNQIQLPFGNGFRCVGGGIQRGQVVAASGSLAGYVYDNSSLKRDLSAYIGTNRKFQFWHRDPMGGGAQFNSSFAVSIDILP